ncbi:MAG: hypothetical protein A3F24_02075 [Candidatus Colwellbacteria bacterium RIFCSPHIGHO2_12_FULL_44_17]|uniref:DUF5652 domain-containing protein n=2 Tax=Candidatus Colwelliibacteriota TaxID=1817904 RepID=A0A1G1Z6M9_9BACT|nr:MAG: hypothetical protein A3F24_02075 [Candidatus Colwellbacteria bacterium RIFCSPHIGHO2_12_FULL_44_17]OGY59327.1 MAG: hypothetical protein A3I31_02310 [Candidatus Colwellbacteria bacterium RIFCSPLOWO2_02_FULL_44_20b]
MAPEQYFVDNMVWLLPLILWTFAWKGVALWKAAQRHDLAWYIVLLLVNLGGVLEILYVAYFSKRKKDGEPQA